MLHCHRRPTLKINRHSFSCNSTRLYSSATEASVINATRTIVHSRPQPRIYFSGRFLPYLSFLSIIPILHAPFFPSLPAIFPLAANRPPQIQQGVWGSAVCCSSVVRGGVSAWLQVHFGAVRVKITHLVAANVVLFFVRQNVFFIVMVNTF